jgi:hypothetical protein
MHDFGGSLMTRQLLYASVGAVLFVGLLFIDPSTYRRFRRPIYFGTLAVMVFVLAAGAATRGSKRWVNVGFFKFQPSEFGKVLFVLVIAAFLTERGRAIGSARAPLAAPHGKIEPPRSPKSRQGRQEGGPPVSRAGANASGDRDRAPGARPHARIGERYVAQPLPRPRVGVQTVRPSEA